MSIPSKDCARRAGLQRIRDSRAPAWGPESPLGRLFEELGDASKPAHRTRSSAAVQRPTSTRTPLQVKLEAPPDRRVSKRSSHGRPVRPPAHEDETPMKPRSDPPETTTAERRVARRVASQSQIKLTLADRRAVLQRGRAARDGRDRRQRPAHDAPRPAGARAAHARRADGLGHRVRLSRGTSSVLRPLVNSAARSNAGSAALAARIARRAWC